MTSIILAQPQFSEILQVPVLWSSALTPAKEGASVKDLYAHLTGLKFSVKAWGAALQLLRTSKNPPPPITRAIAARWRWIACHECIFELYHLRSRLERVQSVGLCNCPSVRAMVDVVKIKGARKKLDEFFPDIEPLRHVIAHRGENEVHPEVHAPDGPYALTRVFDLDGFSTQYQGTPRYLDITEQSLQGTIIVVAEFLGAFEAAAAKLEEQGHLGYSPQGDLRPNARPFAPWRDGDRMRDWSKLSR